MTDILATSADGRSRVVAIQDDYPNEPYDDGGSPVLRFDGRASQVTDITSYVVHPRLVEALERWSGQPGLFERYARAYHGCTSFVWLAGYGWRDPSYVTCDPRDWREVVGAPEGAADMSEWQSYAGGDVWVLRAERLQVWTSDTGETRETWTPVDALHGIYGWSSARDLAASVLADAPVA